MSLGLVELLCFMAVDCKIYDMQFNLWFSCYFSLFWPLLDLSPSTIGISRLKARLRFKFAGTIQDIVLNHQWAIIYAWSSGVQTFCCVFVRASAFWRIPATNGKQFDSIMCKLSIVYFDDNESTIKKWLPRKSTLKTACKDIRSIALQGQTIYRRFSPNGFVFLSLSLIFTPLLWR
jgi:hypothetical protein